jgi:hypothetical protein
MVFYPPKWVPKLGEVPDTVPLCDFVLDEKHGRHPIAKSKDPYTCALSGRTCSTERVREKVNHLSRALSKELGWKVNEGSEYDKVAGIFALNTVYAHPPAHHQARDSLAELPLIGVLD